MGEYNFRQHKAIEWEYKKKWINAFGRIPNTSGIYILTRYENNLKYAYIGQAKHILERLAGHLKGKEQHIDKSLKKHGLYDEITNPNGWRLERYVLCEEKELNDNERAFIVDYANRGYQLRNKTLGGQDEGKGGLDTEIKPSKGYRDGLKQGYKNAIKEIRILFEKYLKAEVKGDTNKIKERKLNEFIELLKENDL